LPAATYLTTPSPLPLLSDVSVIQSPVLAADQAHSRDVVTVTLPLPPVAATDRGPLVSETVHLSPPGPTRLVDDEWQA
jgi:hypothetical protein